MQTPHGLNASGIALSQDPAAWWKDKKGVADQVGNALLISQPTQDKVRRVVGLYQQRASEADPQRVVLKVASAAKDGASTAKLDLVDALDPEKWLLFPHFMEALFEVDGDQAQVLGTEEQGANIVGVRAVLTMAGQIDADGSESLPASHIHHSLG